MIEHFAIITVKNMNEMLTKTHIDVPGYQVDCKLINKNIILNSLPMLSTLLVMYGMWYYLPIDFRTCY